jgi:hypothetical protein
MTAYQRGEVVRTPESLMAYFQLTYDTSVLRGEWMVPDPREGQIVALQARIQDMEANRRGGQANGRQGNNQGGNRNHRENQGGNHNQGGAGRNRNQGNNSNRGNDRGRNSNQGPVQRTFTGRLAWRNVAPAVGDPTTKVVEGEEWMYCAHHGYWCKHLSDACRDRPEGEDEVTANMAAVGIEDVYEDEE